MEFLLLLAVLACPLVMGGTMVWMMRRMRGNADVGDGPRKERAP